jgi:peptidoglycan hydrolase-like protein with peptidoglycan-binding domain
MTAASVRRLQADLARLGYFHHVVTGFYGVVTTAAVRQFQRTAGLKADGIWGPISAAALLRRLPNR